MKDTLISFITAKLAKEKGFDIPIYHYYADSKTNSDKSFILQNGIKRNFNDKDEGCLYSAPSQSLLQKWLREIHKIHITISVGDDDNYAVIVGTYDNQEWVRDEQDEFVPIFYKTYEEALEQGLIQGLKLIK